MHFVTTNTDNPDNLDGKILATLTGEIMQPVRIYYQLLNKAAINRVFSRLKCIELDTKLNRQVWLYQKEAKKLQFKRPYSAVPIEYRPLVIGAFFTEKKTEMYLEVRSIERALAGILFFNQYIKPYIAKIKSATIINRLLSWQDNAASFHHLFNQAKAISTKKTLHAIANLKEKKPLPEAEKISFHYNEEEDITQLQLIFRSRQYIAMQHWQGNKNYTLDDYIQHLTGTHTPDQNDS